MTGHPIPWWAADEHMVNRVELGLVACGEHREYISTCGPCRMYATAAAKRAMADDDPCPCGVSHTRSEHGYDPDDEDD